MIYCRPLTKSSNSNGLDADQFSLEFMILEATLYNFQVIGEAANQLEEKIKTGSP